MALCISGGDLKLTKSSWTLLDHTWTNGLPYLLDGTTYDLYINNKAIPQCTSPMVSTIVGIPFTGSGCSPSLTDDLTDKCNEYITKLLASFLSHADAIFGFRSFWWPSIRYSAPLSNLPLKSNILQRLYFNLIPKMNVNCHFPTVMITLPYFISGLNLPRFE